MAHKELIVAVSMIVTAAPLVASQPEELPATAAPAGGPDTKYCMRVDPFTGSNIERIECWTREKWADQGVNVDKEWAKNGVAVRG